MDNVAIISIDGNVNANQQVQEFCLPPRKQCVVMPEGGLIVPCGEEWMKGHCPVDREYYMPYIPGDVFHFQTLYYVPDLNSLPAYDSIVTATIYFEDGTTSTAFSGKVSAFYNTTSFQIAEVDTTGFDKCFQVRFSNKFGDYCSQWFAPALECSPTIMIRSVGDVDCMGYAYAAEGYVGDNLNYNNQIRIYADIRSTEFSVDKEENESTNTLASSKTINTYNVKLYDKVPPYLKNIISKQHLAFEGVYIDDDYYNLGSVTSRNELEFGHMWLFSFDIEKRCDTKGSGSGYCG